MRRKDAEDSSRICDEIRQQRAEADWQICGECFHPVVADETDPGRWLHAYERLLPSNTTSCRFSSVSFVSRVTFVS